MKTARSKDNRVPIGRSSPFTGRRVQTAVVLLLSLAFLLWILRKLDKNAFVVTLNSTPPSAVLLALAGGYLSVFLRLFQWRLVIDDDRADYFELFKAVCLGYLGSLLLPLRGGEAVKAWFVAQKTGIPLSRVLTSVIWCRMQDILPVLAILAVSVLILLPSGPAVVGFGAGESTYELSNASVLRVLLSLSGSAAASVALLLLLVRHAPYALRLINWIGTWLPTAWADKLRKIAEDVIEGTKAAAAWRRLVTAQLIAFLCWGLFVVAQIPLLLAFGFTWDHVWLSSIAVVGLTTVGHMLPAAPGAFGTYHAFCIIALLLCRPETTREAATAYAVVSHLVGTFGPALLGLPFIPILLTAKRHSGVESHRTAAPTGDSAKTPGPHSHCESAAKHSC